MPVLNIRAPISIAWSKGYIVTLDPFYRRPDILDKPSTNLLNKRSFAKNYLSTINAIEAFNDEKIPFDEEIWHHKVESDSP